VKTVHWLDKNWHRLNPWKKAFRFKTNLEYWVSQPEVLKVLKNYLKVREKKSSYPVLKLRGIGLGLIIKKKQ